MTTTTSTTTNGEMVRQTRQMYRYRSGHGLVSIITFNADEDGTSTSCEKEIGLNHEADGVFLQWNGTNWGIVLRTGSSDSNRIVQSAWNQDTLNGSGASGITLDFTKSQILVLDLQWLAVGTVSIIGGAEQALLAGDIGGASSGSRVSVVQFSAKEHKVNYAQI